MIDPHDIERVEFSTTRLKAGYDPDEVDNYLDRVADSIRSRNEELNRAHDEIVTLRRRIAELERRADDVTAQIPVIDSVQAGQPPSVAAARLLQLAQKTADDVTAQAQQEAMAIIARADESARDIVNEATAEADVRRQQAESKLHQAERDLDLLADTRRAVRGQLESQLDELRKKLGDPA